MRDDVPQRQDNAIPPEPVGSRYNNTAKQEYLQQTMKNTMSSLESEVAQEKSFLFNPAVPLQHSPQPAVPLKHSLQPAVPLQHSPQPAVPLQHFPQPAVLLQHSPQPVQHLKKSLNPTKRDESPMDSLLSDSAPHVKNSLSLDPSVLLTNSLFSEALKNFLPQDPPLPLKNFLPLDSPVPLMNSQPLDSPVPVMISQPLDSPVPPKAGKIVGGSRVERGQFPFMVSLMHSPGYRK